MPVNQQWIKVMVKTVVKAYCLPSLFLLFLAIWALNTNIAKLRPIPILIQFGAELVIFPFNPATHPPNHPPDIPEK